MHKTSSLSRLISSVLVFSFILTFFPITSYADSTIILEKPIPVILSSGSKPGSFNATPKMNSFTTADDVVINWTSSKGATKYGLTVVNDKTNKVVFDQYVTGNSKNIGKLPEGKYRFQMAAYNSNGSSPLSAMAYFSVKPAVCTPKPPTYCTPIPVNNSRINDTSVINFNTYKNFQLSDGACVLFAMTSLVRRAQFLNGEKSYFDCQASFNNIGSCAWDWKSWDVAGSWAQKTYNATNIKARYERKPTQTLDHLVDLLNKHPEGVVCYFYEPYPTHAVLITRYSDGQLFCIDYYNTTTTKTTAYEEPIENSLLMQDSGGLGYPKDYSSFLKFWREAAFIEK